MARTAISDILQLEDIAELNNEFALDAIAHLIDYAGDQGDVALAGRALGWCDEIEKRDLADNDQVLLDYYRANAWACYYQVKTHDRAASWVWEQPEIQQQVFLLRRAHNNPAFPSLSIVRRCQILTNLGNQLDTIGRFVEARAYWTKALVIEPDFWMARANRGRALMHYSNALYDTGHQDVFALHAHADLVAATVSIHQKPHFGNAALLPFFSQHAATIARHFNIEAIRAKYRPDSHSIGRTEVEEHYRRWCLRQVLFLNPLNDLEPRPIAARDMLMLPSFVTSINEPPVLIGFFNQLKQEFVSARWLYYEAIESKEPHLSDRGALLYNTLDYPSYGLAVEKVKVAFRMTYSIFDKIAFFLNRYLQLGIPEKKINFRSVWHEKGAIRVGFDTSENWPLRGLYWLSKDIFDGEMRDVTEPDARELHELRNHLEHKYVKVHEMSVRSNRNNISGSDPFIDDLAYAITRNDLERKTLRLLKLVRAALIYLSLGMHNEEKRRQAEGGHEKYAMPMELGTIDDRWKR